MATRKTTAKTVKPTKNKEKKFTTSKIIVLASYVIGIVLTIFTIWGMLKGYDVSALTIITTAAYAEIAASNAFYFWKAKKENTMKIALAAVKETPTEQVDDIARLIEVMGGIV